MEQIEDVIEVVGLFVKDVWSIIPKGIKIAICIIALVAVVNILLSLIKAIIDNRQSWKPMPNSLLMYSFAAGSGNFQRRNIYKDAHKYLFDKTWSLFSFAGLAFRLGNVNKDSMSIAALLSIVYIPLALAGMIEMVLRIVIGVTFFLLCNLSYIVLLLILAAANLILMPVFFMMDKTTWTKQHCPNDYSSFYLPVFECPHCKSRHDKLFPGRGGLLWAKCSCGAFIPCSSLTKRKKLTSYCPKCGFPLAAANAKTLSIQIVGGNSSGKTSFIAALQHQYLASLAQNERNKLVLSPVDRFGDLDRMFTEGRTFKSPSDQVHTFSIVHTTEGAADVGLTIYDVPDEIILSEQYDKNPLNYGYCDGIALIIDPLSVSTVRDECIKVNGATSVRGYSNDSPEDIAIHFINKFSEVAGRSARKMSRIPVAVIISKSDLTIIKRQVGLVKIKSESNQYSSFSEARNAICRNYLVQIGLANILNNLESVFSNVSYFPISAIGHIETPGDAYEPQGVMSPVDWIIRECGSPLYAYSMKARRS